LAWQTGNSFLGYGTRSQRIERSKKLWQIPIDATLKIQAAKIQRVNLSMQFVGSGSNPTQMVIVLKQKEDLRTRR